MWHCLYSPFQLLNHSDAKLRKILESICTILDNFQLGIIIAILNKGYKIKGIHNVGKTFSR